jgi:uncharacterized membrane protein
MTRSIWLWPIVIICSAVGIGLLVFGDVTSPIRPVLALWFLLICPGMALARLLRIQDNGNELTLAIALSLAIDAMLAIGMAYAKLWSIQWGLSILIGISVIGATLQIVTAYRRPSHRIAGEAHNNKPGT